MKYYLITELDAIQQRASKFKFTCCSIHDEWIAFGTSTGSIHMYNLKTKKFPNIISESQISTSIKALKFSPSGNFLLVCEENRISIVENPKEKPNFTTKFELGANTYEDSCWISDPPILFDRNTIFIYVGDRNGNIHALSRASDTIVASVNSPIFQISLVDKNLLINSISGVYLMTPNFQISPIRSKRPNGKFGGIYVQQFDAICFARPEAKLLLATSQGKVRVSLSLFEKDEIPKIPDGYDLNLSYLMVADTFLISYGLNSTVIIVDLSEGKLCQCLPMNSNCINVGAQGNHILIMWQDKISLFKTYDTADDYIVDLLELNNFKEIQRVAIESKIEDIERLESFIDKNISLDEQKEFTYYIARVKLLSEPRLLKDCHPDIYEEIMKDETASQESVKKLFDVIKSVKFDDELKSRIEGYVLKHPEQWSDWKGVINVDKLIPILNENEEYYKYAMEMAPLGISQLAKLLATAEGLPIAILVANSPPIHPYNVDFVRRAEYLRVLGLNDQFTDEVNPESIVRSSSIERLINEVRFIESPTNDLIDSIGESTDPNDIKKIMMMSEWEESLENSVDELHNLAERYMLTKVVKDVPAWVNDPTIHHIAEGSGNWGVTSELHECINCGLPLVLEQDASSVTAFPCGHVYHAKCLHTRYCPLCYSMVLK